jgi:hypothetical protein
MGEEIFWGSFDLPLVATLPRSALRMTGIEGDLVAAMNGRSFTI